MSPWAGASRRRHASGRSLLLLVLALVLAVFFSGFGRPGDDLGRSARQLAQVPYRAQRQRVQALLRGPRKGLSLVLFNYGDYEMGLRRGKGQWLPRLMLREKPARAVELRSAGMSVEAEGTEGFKGFPFTTANAGSLQLDFPRVGGRLAVAAKEFAESSDDDYDEGRRRGLEVVYAQKLPLFGDASAHLHSGGKWSAAFSRDLEELGKLTGELDSQLDWKLDLTNTYQPVRGVTPTVSYGATQDGLCARARLSGSPAAGVLCSYAVRNAPGQYAPSDWRHDCEVEVASEDGRRSLRAAGHYDQRLPTSPLRGEVSYAAQTRLGELSAALDAQRLRLRCRGARGVQVAAAVDRAPAAGVEASKDASDFLRGRGAELELQVGKAKAAAVLVPGSPQKPRLRLALER